MQLGTEIGKMTRKLFTRFSKSPPWMLATSDRTETHQISERLRDDLAPSLRKHVVASHRDGQRLGCIASLGLLRAALSEQHRNRSR